MWLGVAQSESESERKCAKIGAPIAKKMCKSEIIEARVIVA